MNTLRDYSLVSYIGISFLLGNEIEIFVFSKNYFEAFLFVFNNPLIVKCDGMVLTSSFNRVQNIISSVECL